MAGETIRDVVFRLRIELAEQQMKAPDVRPVVEAQEKVTKATKDSAKAAEDAARARERADDRIRQSLERYGRQVERQMDRERALRERAAEAQIRAAERAEVAQTRAVERAGRAQARAMQLADKAILKTIDSAVTLARGVALLGLAGEKDTEKLVRGFVRISAAVDILRGLVGTYDAIRKAIQAATAAQVAFNLAQAGGGARGGGRLSAAGSVLGMGGRAGLIGAGTAVGLGVISLFDQGTREGLGELLGFSDMAGDERERSASMRASGEAYNRAQAIRRAGGNRASQARIERDKVGMSGLDAANQTASALRAQLGQSNDPRRELELVNQIAAVEKQRLMLIQERVRSQRESIAATQKELEARNSALGAGALGFLGMSRGDQRGTVRAVEKLQRGEQLSVRELQLASAQSQFIGEEGRRNLDSQARARAGALGFNTVSGAAQQDVRNIEYQLQAQRGALDATIQKYGEDFKAAQERIVKSILDQVIAAINAAAEFAASEENRQSLIRSAQTNVGGIGAGTAFGRGLIQAPFFAPFVGGSGDASRRAVHRPKPNS